MEDITKSKGITGYGLLELYAGNFGVDGCALHDLACMVANHKDDHDGDVDAVIADFVYAKFYSDMIRQFRIMKTAGRNEIGMTFDEYASRIRFPYAREAFTGYLRDVWKDASKWALEIVSLDREDLRYSTL